VLRAGCFFADSAGALVVIYWNNRVLCTACFATHVPVTSAMTVGAQLISPCSIDVCLLIVSRLLICHIWLQNSIMHNVKLLCFSYGMLAVSLHISYRHDDLGGCLSASHAAALQFVAWGLEGGFMLVNRGCTALLC
jgi:hypothetical protein